MEVSKQQVSLGQVLRKTIIYILEQMRLLSSGNYMTNREQKITRIKLFIEEQHAHIGKLKKGIRMEAR